MAPHKFDEWQVDLEFDASAKTSAAYRHVRHLRGLLAVRSFIAISEPLRLSISEFQKLA
jgi:hypothetical protein